MSEIPRPDPTRVLVEQLLGDQKHQFQNGSPVRVEDYLSKHPELGDDPDAMLDLLYQEFVLRERMGETPDVDEYVERFPELATEINLQFRIDDAFADGDFDSTDFTQSLASGQNLPPDGPVTQTEPRPVPGYDILEVLGRGGMGVVYKAVQLRPRRVVALKMILAGDHASDEHRARFLQEAEAIARLQHPNIVQIFEVSETDGNPFFALEYVEGGTLAHRFSGTPQPARFACELVETVAHATHAAHQQGIIHRDLKPANILLRAEGKSDTNSQEQKSTLPPKDNTKQTDEEVSATGSQTLVPKITDFGLARLVESDSAQTQTGQFMGTPSYCAPEQAAGQIREIGPLTDVYALGAILYEALTGRPPFRGTTPVETLMLVQYQEPVSPRALNPSVPKDLETICLKCLRKKPEDRYPSGLALAEDLRRFQQDEPILARPVGTIERGVKWSRRHPMTVAFLAAVLLLVVGGVAAGFAYLKITSDRAAERAQQQIENQKIKAERAKQEFEAELRRLKKAERRKQAEAQIRIRIGDVQQEGRALQKLLEEPGGVFRLLNTPANWQQRIDRMRYSWERANDIQKRSEAGIDPGLEQQLGALKLKLDEDQQNKNWAMALEAAREKEAMSSGATPLLQEGIQMYGDVFRRFGIDIMTQTPERILERIRESPIRERWIAGLQAWSTDLRLTLPRSDLESEALYARIVTVLRSDTTDPLVRAMYDPRIIGSRSACTELAQSLLQDREKLRRLSPQTAEVLGQFLGYHGANATPWLKRVQEIYPRDFWLAFDLGNDLSTEQPELAEGYFRIALAVRPNSVVAWNALGLALLKQEKLKAAQVVFTKAVEIAPTSALVKTGLGDAFMRLGDIDQAYAVTREAIQNDATFGLAWNNLSLLLRKKRQWTEAAKAAKKATELDPNDERHWLNLGLALRKLDQPDEARHAFEKAREVTPKNATAWAHLGGTYLDQNRLQEAERHLNEAMKLNPRLAVNWANKCVLLARTGKLQEAVGAFRKTLELDSVYSPEWGKLKAVFKELTPRNDAEKIQEHNEQVASFWAGIGEAYLTIRPKKLAKRASQLADKKRWNKAGLVLKTALEYDPKCAWAWLNRSILLREQGQHNEAVSAAKKATKLAPKDYRAFYQLGFAFRKTREFEEAHEALKTAHRLAPQNAEVMAQIGVVHLYLGNRNEGTEWLEKATRLDSKITECWVALGQVWAERGEMRKAAEAFQKVLTIDPTSTAGWNDLGKVYMEFGESKKAAEAFRKATELEPDDHRFWIHLGIAAAQQGDQEEAAAAFRKSVRVAPTSPDSHYNLGLVRLSRGDFQEALRSLRRAQKLGAKLPNWREPVKERIRQGETMLAFDHKVTGVASGKVKVTDPQELLKLAHFCFQAKQQYRLATKFYDLAFTQAPRLIEDLSTPYGSDAPQVAVVASKGMGRDGEGLRLDEQARLRGLALSWLRVRLEAIRKEKATAPLQLIQREGELRKWLQTSVLAAVRDKAHLAKLPDEEQQNWETLWVETRTLHKSFRDRFQQRLVRGELTNKQTVASLPVQMKAGNTYIIDMESQQFDTMLGVTHSEGQMLAQNDDIVPNENLNSRIVFTPKESGPYEILATSFRQQGRGAYQITISEFTKKS
ncbi:MAG: tetratricopeptide repeat protein [Gemmataceae bacterium]